MAKKEAKPVLEIPKDKLKKHPDDFKDFVAGQLSTLAVRDAIEVYIERGPKASGIVMSQVLGMDADAVLDMIAALDELSHQELTKLMADAYKEYSEGKTATEIEETIKIEEVFGDSRDFADKYYDNAWDDAVAREKKTGDIDPLLILWQFLGNSAYDLTQMGYTKKEIVETVSAAILAAKRQMEKDKPKKN